MKRVLGFVSVLLVIALAGCAQIDPASIVQGPPVVQVSELKIIVDGSKTWVGPADFSPKAYLWVAGELAEALGGARGTWGGVYFKKIGEWKEGEIVEISVTGLDTFKSESSWDNGDDKKLSFKFVVTTDPLSTTNTIPNDTDIADSFPGGYDNIPIPLEVPTSVYESGAEQSVKSKDGVLVPGVTYVIVK